jgi:hypothetical protein
MVSIPQAPLLLSSVQLPPSMARSFDTGLAALQSLADADPSTTLEPLRKALTHKNNLIVAKAAKLAQQHGHTALTEDLAQAFPRFLQHTPKSDPQCWAKNAIVQALAAFEYQEPELFLAGLTHVQPEPVWGGQEDTAGTLRGHCALALVQCRTLSSTAILTHLAPLFADKILTVQVNAARAVEQIGNDTASLLLRLRAELASGEPELLGACYSGVLRLDGPRAIPWAAKFLPGGKQGPDEASAEAAFAIAETRTEQAFETLQAAWKQTRDRDFRSTLLTAIALTRQERAIEFLLGQAAEGSTAAREALENSAPAPEVLARLRAL